MDYIGYIGFAAGTVSVISFIPQALRVWRTRSTKDLSASTYTMLITGAILWSTYGLLKNEWPIILPNIIILVIQSTILMAKLRYK